MEGESAALARLDAGPQSPSGLLETLHVGFRSRYLPFDDLTKQVEAWARAFPEVVRLEAIGTSKEGRPIWLLTIGPEPDRLRPAAWVDGNIHASELTGSSVALSIAEDAIRAHVAPGAPVRDLPAHIGDLLRQDVLLYVLPRLCPDGAEQVLTTGRWVRSNPRDDRAGNTAPYWRHADVDGDGLALCMRRQDPVGDFVASTEIPNLLLKRRVEDPPPYYQVFPEGFVEHWDGFTVPSPDYLSDNETDMNRNFPFGWKAEPDQKGGGPFPASEPESRAVTDFALRHPNIFVWLSLHTYGGCYIRPMGDRSDKKMDQVELALFKQIEEWTLAITGYPMVSGYEEFTYEPDKPLAGDLESFAIQQRGAIAMVVELWDFWKQAGLTIHRPFVENYGKRTREDLVKIARWDAEHNQGRVVGAWRSVVHPQLGPVEVGGYDPRFGLWNPPPERLHELCEQQSRVFLRMASLAPRLRVRDAAAERIGPDLWRVTAIVENAGYLPTYVLPTSKGFPWNDPVRARLVVEPGAEIVGDPETLVGHLEGWANFDKDATPSLARSARVDVRRRLAWVVRGRGAVTIGAGCARAGRVEARIQLG